MKTLTVTHAQMRDGRSDDAAIDSRILVHDDSQGGIYFTGPREADPTGYKHGWGCSRTYRATLRDALSQFMRENGQRLLGFTDGEPLLGH